MTMTIVLLLATIVVLAYHTQRLKKKLRRPEKAVDLYLYAEMPTWNPGPLPSTQEIITQLKSHRAVHLQWVAYLTQHPETDATMVGDVIHHQKVSDIYSDMIKSLGG